MTRIRPLDRADLHGVCQLYESIFRSGSPNPPARLVRYFERTMLDHPWVDPEIPSLVCEDDDGSIIGFLGSMTRRMRLDGRPVRISCSAPLFVDATARRAGVAAAMVRRFFAGPQELTFSDGASGDVRRIFATLNLFPVLPASIGWTRTFRPVATSAAVLSRTRPPRLVRALRAAAPLLDAAALAMLGRSEPLQPPEPAADAEPLTVELLLEQMAAAAGTLRLYPDYDTDYLRWLFEELEAVDARGIPVRRLVRDRSGRVAGWYIYYLKPGGVAQVLQVAAPGRDPKLVLDHLFWHAARGGAIAVQGRLEPSLVSVLNARWVLSNVVSAWAVAHCADPSILGLLGSTKSLLTRMDGDWWMGHHVLWPEERGPGVDNETSTAIVNS